jgi:pSer/pThr/pTyr-binding forkhead associated (FHA) protein
VFRAATGGRFWVEDLESLNGTTVNGKPVKLGVLREGDAVGVGGFELKFGLRK